MAEQLQGALNSRIVIEQAKGFLAEQLSVTVDDGFSIMRRYARSNHRKLTDVATDITAGRLDLARPPASRETPPVP